MFHTRRKKHGGTIDSVAKRLKTLEEENAELRRLLAKSMVDISPLREIL